MIAAAIAEALPKGRKSGASYVACCPAHEDANPSLSIRDADHQQVLVHCHAGCDQRAVIEALRARGLWRDHTPSQRRTIAATYDYTDECGNLLYQVVRLEPKAFFQRRPDGAGGWINKKGARQVLYRLKEVTQASIVLIVEGERDVETLRSHGFVATTNAGGAKAPWLDGYTQALESRDCVLIPDNDRVGWKRVEIIARALLGNASRIRIVNLPWKSKDISDWFTAGHSECELTGLLKDNRGV